MEIIGAGFLGILFICLGAFYFYASKRKREKIRGDWEAEKGEVLNLTGELATLQTQNQSLENQLEEINKQKEEVRKAKEKVEGDLGNEKDKVLNLTSESATLQTKNQNLENQLEEIKNQKEEIRRAKEKIEGDLGNEKDKVLNLTSESATLQTNNQSLANQLEKIKKEKEEIRREKEKIESDLGVEKDKVLNLTSESATLQTNNQNLANQLEKIKKEKEEIRREKEKIESDLGVEKDKVLNLTSELTAIETNRQNLEDRLKEQKWTKEFLEGQMRDLLNQTHRESVKTVTQTSRQQWESLITPFKEEIQKLEGTVKTTYDKESRETLSLKSHLESIHKTYKEMNTQTSSLAKALRGDSKTQGNWGEMILERLLETAGLTKGREYVVQGRGLGLKNEEEKNQKPDVVVNLPGERHIIIDSKVSITSYEAYRYAVDTGNFEGQTKAHKELLKSVESHIKDLSGKDYARLGKLNSPDYVFMFLPNDGMFATIIQLNREIYERSLSEKGICLVSPSFLMPILRLVKNIWQTEKQNTNALKIADEAGKLYDKFVGFSKDLEGIQKFVKKAGEATEDAVKKLKGKGSIVSKIENLKEMGARTKSKKKLDVEHIGPDIQVENRAQNLSTSSMEWPAKKSD